MSNDVNKLWNLYLKEVEKWYTVTPKNFLGSADAHKEQFLKAFFKWIDKT